MAGAAQDAGRDFWQPHLEAQSASSAQLKAGHEQLCSRCGTEFLEGARFCHLCGATNLAAASSAGVRWHNLHPADLFRHLGLSTAPLMALLAGLSCLSAALLASLFFAVQTGADWESLQYWRIDWLLAATATFTAGILLKKK